MLTFLVTLLIFGFVGSAPPQSDLLYQKLISDGCGFQLYSPKLIPKSCAVKLPGNNLEFKEETVEIYLCLALLEVKTQLCNLNNPTKSTAFKFIPFDISHVDDDTEKICARMASLSSPSDQVRVLYENLNRLATCFNTCSALASDVSSSRTALCEVLYSMHELLKQSSHQTSDKNDDDPQHPPINRLEGKPGKVAVKEDHLQSSKLDTPSQGANQTSLPLPVSASGKHPAKIPMKDQVMSENDSPKPGVSSSSVLRSSIVTSEAKLTKQNTNENGGRQPVPKGNDLNGAAINSNSKDTIDVSLDSPKLSIDQTDGHEESNHLDFKQGTNNAAGKPTDVQDNVREGPGTHPVSSVSEGIADTKKNSETKFSEPDVEKDMNTNAADDLEEGDDNFPDANRPQAQDDPEDDPSPETNQQSLKPDTAPKANDGSLPSSQRYGYTGFVEAEDSHFFAYFMSLSAFFIICYLAYHNKRKIIAIAVEGKKGRSTGRRRPHSASYHKLDSNLEEAMSSNVTSTNSYVIY